MQEKDIDLKNCLFVFTAIAERRQLWKSERKGIWHADGWWVNNTKCLALYGLQSV